MAVPRKVIAVIDDDETILETMGGLLSSYGYRTELYLSAEKFIEAAPASKAACLLIDVQLGDISGVELGRQLATMGLAFPIIFMTGSRDQAQHKQAMDFGCVGYLHKPFSTDQLMQAITRAVGFTPRLVETNLENGDPLLTLLRRYRAQREVFDNADADRLGNEAWDQLARQTWYATRNEIIKSEPPATTAAGALLALDHVLESDDLLGERSQVADHQLLWLLVKAARDFIDSTKHRDAEKR